MHGTGNECARATLQCACVDAVELMYQYARHGFPIRPDNGALVTLGYTLIVDGLGLRVGTKREKGGWEDVF
ncbi:hypothetical protein RRG08_027091 [Elysia crispata]|uniref:Uncharacterized protein n=1 Tax=Elysia crispata TaxID=231223 RepID=A0AAE1D440_9GAST|nr:hypothetical protein RRG08_027091 [Elysia crispata]